MKKPVNQKVRRRLLALMWAVWVIGVYLISAVVAVSVNIYIRGRLGNSASDYSIYRELGSLLVQLLIATKIIITVPYLVGRHRSDTPARRRAQKMRLLGIVRLPEKKDIWPVIGAVVVYHLAAVAILGIANFLINPSILNRSRYTGFHVASTNGVEIVSLIIVLAIVTPILVEIIFRGFLYGKLESLVSRTANTVIVTLVYMVTFGAFVDVLNALVVSLIACYLRRKTKSLWAGIGMHMVVNLVAVVTVYVLPLFSL